MRSSLLQGANALEAQPRPRFVRAAAAAAARTHPARSQQHGSLRLFLDSADVSQWEHWAPTGVLHGFTTNPLILQRDGVPCTLAACKQLLDAASRLGAKELQCQAWGGSADALEESALGLLELDPDFITVKLPCTPEGLSAAAAVLRTDPAASITITGVYEPHQLLLAQALGADYAAPYVGRMADAAAASPHGSGDWDEAFDGVAGSVGEMARAVRAAGSSMRVLVASIRRASDIAALAAQGCDTFTFSASVMRQLCCVDATEAAVLEFEAAAAAPQKK